MSTTIADPHLDDAAIAVARRLDGRSLAVAEWCTDATRRALRLLADHLIETGRR